MKEENELKKQVLATLHTLPLEALKEVAVFLDYLQYKLVRCLHPKTPYKPVSLGGLWKGITITDSDIADVRREMWDSFEERDEL